MVETERSKTRSVVIKGPRSLNGSFASVKLPTIQIPTTHCLPDLNSDVSGDVFHLSPFDLRRQHGAMRMFPTAVHSLNACVIMCLYDVTLGSQCDP